MSQAFDRLYHELPDGRLIIKKSEFGLTTYPGGCGVIIPYTKRGMERKWWKTKLAYHLEAVEKNGEEIWCGLASSREDVPQSYFRCVECRRVAPTYTPEVS